MSASSEDEPIAVPADGGAPATSASEAPTAPIAVLTIDRAPGGGDAPPVVIPDPPARAASYPPSPAGQALFRPTDLRRLAGQVLLAWGAMLVGFIIFVGFLSSFPQARGQLGLERHFKTLLANAQAPIGGVIPPGTPIAKLEIPAIGLRQIVVEGTNADELRKGPGHFRPSPLPGQIGNAVLAAHAVAYGGPFEDLRALRKGDLIHTLTGQGSFTYRVTGIATYANRDTSALRATPDNRLTLVTSNDWLASRRLVVMASLASRPQPAPAARLSLAGAAESGLAGGGGGGPALALWLEVLVVVAVATVLIYRRLPRWSSYLVTTPVLLGAVWLVYTTLGRFLPATL